MSPANVQRKGQAIIFYPCLLFIYSFILKPVSLSSVDCRLKTVAHEVA